MSEQKWKTPREAYCDGYEDGLDAGEHIGFISAVPVCVATFIIGVAVGVMI